MLMFPLQYLYTRNNSQFGQAIMVNRLSEWFRCLCCNMSCYGSQYHYDEFGQRIGTGGICWAQRLTPAFYLVSLRMRIVLLGSTNFHHTNHSLGVDVSFIQLRTERFAYRL